MNTNVPQVPQCTRKEESLCFPVHDMTNTDHFPLSELPIDKEPDRKLWQDCTVLLYPTGRRATRDTFSRGFCHAAIESSQLQIKISPISVLILCICISFVRSLTADLLLPTRICLANLDTTISPTAEVTLRR
ncbi:hypothetical protein TWF751_005557 [Orbilia oligospora]|nr:hypothetical protein TWF751_005557 [Orbilia oligospora]